MLFSIVFFLSAILGQNWVGTWSTGPQLVEPDNNPPSPGLANNTLRQVVRISIGGSNIRLRFSNAFSEQAVTMQSVAIAVSRGGSTIDTNSGKLLMFKNAESVTMAAKGEVYSDPISFDLQPDSLLAITICFGATSSSVTGHPGSRTTSYIASGYHIADATLNGATTDHWYVIETVDVEATGNAATAVVLGDSITDGRGSGTNKQNRWTDILSQRLLKNSATANVGVLNLGIGGNTVLSGGLGPTAQARFDRDVLSQSGVKWLLILEGINDLGNGGAVGQNLINAFGEMIQKAHAQGIKVYGCTILPFGKSGYDNTGAQQAAKTVNDWIRTGGKYDGVIDFYQVMGDSSNPDSMQSGLQSGDYLHPNEAGYQKMGEAVDLNLFKL